LVTVNIMKRDFFISNCILHLLKRIDNVLFVILEKDRKIGEKE